VSYDGYVPKCSAERCRSACRSPRSTTLHLPTHKGPQSAARRSPRSDCCGSDAARASGRRPFIRAQGARGTAVPGSGDDAQAGCGRTVKPLAVPRPAQPRLPVPLQPPPSLGHRADRPQRWRSGPQRNDACAFVAAAGAAREARAECSRGSARCQRDGRSGPAIARRTDPVFDLTVGISLMRLPHD